MTMRTTQNVRARNTGQLQRKPPAATLPFDRETQKAFRKRRRSRSAKGSARSLEGGA